MARQATSIVLKYPDFIRNSTLLQNAIAKANQISEHKDRKSALEEPAIILTTAGMLNGGPVLGYITKLNKNSNILLTGYQVEGTNGRMLLDTGEVFIKNNRVKIDTPVKFYDFSAHSGMSDLYNYIKESSPKVVICVHGDPSNASDLAESLKLEGFEAYAPKIGETINID
jgi:putative mRNA 3-end processing factor